MAVLKTALRKWLRNAEKTALLGVGSEFRGDDAAGVIVAKQLSAVLKVKKNKSVKVFIADTAPENLTGEIRKFRPTHLIVIDSADMGKKAGEVELMDSDKASGFTFCTHNLPMNILADYLTKTTGCKIAIIGIQPKTLDFGGAMSKEVEKAVKYISSIIKRIVLSWNPK